MNTHHALLTGAALALLLAGSPQAAFTQAATPAPTTVPTAPQSASVAAVQQFLTTRAAGQYAQAYALLSPESQKMLPMDQFQKADLPTNANASGMTPLMMAIALFFLDSHGTSGYKFAVKDALPDNANIVLVRAQPPGAAAPLQIKIVITPDPATHTPRLDIMDSMNVTDPRGLEMSRVRSEQIVSASNEYQIALGIIQYVQDHNEMMPDAGRWVDEIMPYVKSEAVFHDPKAPDGQQWSYAFNKALSGRSLAQISDPAATVMIFESTLGTKNATDTGQSVPHPGWHQNGTDYGFADGHAKWLHDGEKPSFTTGLVAVKPEPPPMPADPALAPRPGEVRVEGTVRDTSVGQKRLVLWVSRVTEPGHAPTDLDAPRPKTILIVSATRLHSAAGKSVPLASFQPGDAVIIVGKSMAPGKPLVARLIAAGP